MCIHLILLPGFLMPSDPKFFPIKTQTACQLKWAWSTIFLNIGDTGSCHRTSLSRVSSENFVDFHNTPTKLADRNRMLQGLWPETSCVYCKKIEQAGGSSDRMRQLSVPDLVPPELDADPTATRISPTILEVYFSNACNMGCLYCMPAGGLSSVIAAENVKFGKFKNRGVDLETIESQYSNLLPEFWKWFPEGFPKLRRFHALGGEPLIQKEFEKLLSMIEQYPNPTCELNIVSNLMISQEKIQYYVNKFRKLLIERKIGRIDISCSIDCWGPQQEYVRWGIDLDRWEKNFQFLMKHKWLYLNINQCITPLTVKTMPELLIKLAEWRKDRKIGHWFSGAEPGPDYMRTDIMPGDEFRDDAQKILSLLPTDTKENINAYDYMKGYFTQICESPENPDQIANLIIYLDEKDRRRGTDWTVLFPWLVKYRKYVV
jgi:hypothetical protein